MTTLNESDVAASNFQIALDRLPRRYAIVATSTYGHLLIFHYGWHFVDDSEFDNRGFAFTFETALEVSETLAHLMTYTSDFWDANLFEFRTRVVGDPEHATVVKESCKLVEIGARVTNLNT